MENKCCTEQVKLVLETDGDTILTGKSHECHIKDLHGCGKLEKCVTSNTPRGRGS